MPKKKTPKKFKVLKETRNEAGELHSYNDETVQTYSFKIDSEVLDTAAQHPDGFIDGLFAAVRERSNLNPNNPFVAISFE